MSRSLDMVKVAKKALEDKKAQDIKVIDIRDVTVIADYFLIADGSNPNQVQAMVDNVEEMLAKAGYECRQIEGSGNGGWVGRAQLGTEGTANNMFGDSGDLACATAGTYRLTYNYKTNTLDIYTVTAE